MRAGLLLIGMVLAAEPATAQMLNDGRGSLSPLSGGNFTFVPAASNTAPAPSQIDAYQPTTFQAPLPATPVNVLPVPLPITPPPATGYSAQGYGQDFGPDNSIAPPTYLPAQPAATATYQPSYIANPPVVNYTTNAPNPGAMYPGGTSGKAEGRSLASPPTASPVYGHMQAPALSNYDAPVGFPVPGRTSTPVPALYGGSVLLDGQEFKGMSAMPQQAGFYTLVAHNNAEFVDLWRTHIGQEPPNTALMPGQVAVFATTGAQNYTGHDVTLKLLGYGQGKVQIIATELMPSSAVAQVRADISPWKVLIVRADNNKVEVLQRKALMGSTLN